MVYRTHISTITYNPKTARGDWTKLLSAKLKKTADNPGEVVQWTRLNMLARAVLPAGGGGSQWVGDSRAQEAKVK
jgi:hypothetical protein